jgi:predicted DNA-binding transcriptional regulator AlpA
MRAHEFIPLVQLSELTGFAVTTLYNQHSSGKGVVAPILTRLGGRVGAWRPDYDQWVAMQRKLPPQDHA